MNHADALERASSDEALPLEVRIQAFSVFNDPRKMICCGCGKRSFTGWCSEKCKSASWRRTLDYVRHTK